MSFCCSINVKMKRWSRQVRQTSPTRGFLGGSCCVTLRKGLFSLHAPEAMSRVKATAQIKRNQACISLWRWFNLATVSRSAPCASSSWIPESPAQVCANFFRVCQTKLKICYRLISKSELCQSKKDLIGLHRFPHPAFSGVHQRWLGQPLGPPKLEVLHSALGGGRSWDRRLQPQVASEIANCQVKNLRQDSSKSVCWHLKTPMWDNFVSFQHSQPRSARLQAKNRFCWLQLTWTWM